MIHERRTEQLRGLETTEYRGHIIVERCGECGQGLVQDLLAALQLVEELSGPPGFVVGCVIIRHHYGLLGVPRYGREHTRDLATMAIRLLKLLDDDFAT